MSKSKIYLSVSAFVIIAFYTLKYFELINFSLIELLAFGTCFLGFIKVIIGFDAINRWNVFFGTIIFLSGITVIVLYHFEFFTPLQIIFPAMLMILGGAFIMLFLTSTDNSMLLFISAVLNGFALIIIIKNGRADLMIFLKNLWEFIANLWYLLLMLAGLIYFLRDKK